MYLNQTKPENISAIINLYNIYTAVYPNIMMNFCINIIRMAFDSGKSQYKFKFNFIFTLDT